MSRHPQGWRRGHQCRTGWPWGRWVPTWEPHRPDIITCVRVVVAQESRKAGTLSYIVVGGPIRHIPPSREAGSASPVGPRGSRLWRQRLHILESASEL